MSDWYDPAICLPLDKAVVEVLGNPTFCCEEDMDEEGVYPCIFLRELSTWTPDMKHYTFSEIFEVCEDEPTRHMEIVKKWRPLHKMQE